MPRTGLPQVARVDAAQAAFDRKVTHYRQELLDLRNQDIHDRLLVWTADGRPQPAVTRTLQHAADIASSRNGQHLSAKILHRRWKHEIQIARILQHGQSGSSQASSTEHCTTGDMSPLLTDGGPGDDDLDDFKTDTAIPDDDDGIVSLASYRYESV